MANNNVMAVLWLDPLEQLSSVELSAFTAQGLAVSQSSSANLSDEDISSADVVVVSLSRNVDLLKQLQSRQASVNAIAPIVARVPREMFELGI